MRRGAVTQWGRRGWGARAREAPNEAIAFGCMGITFG
jgi:hypothetical protein